jgi:thioredoxin reductase
MVHGAAIIGGGPAGLSAAMWMGRHRCSAVLIDAGEHRNRWVEQAHGYLGRDPLDPRRLIERARRDLAEYDTIDVVHARAHEVRRIGDDPDDLRFEIHTDGGVYTTRRIVLATGVVDDFPDVQGFFEHYGADVFHCPVCDGYEARDKHIVVFGWGEHIPGFALGLLTWASGVTVVTDGNELHADATRRQRLVDAGVTVIEDQAVELCGSRGALRAVRLRSGTELHCELAFFSIAHRPVSDFATRLGCATTPEGYVDVDNEACTCVPGVYAAGDLTPGVQLIQVAAAKGTIAGVACARSLWSAPEPLRGSRRTEQV